MADDSLIFGGSRSPRLTRKICEYLVVQPGAGEVLRSSQGSFFVRVQENVRRRRVSLVHSLRSWRWYAENGGELVAFLGESLRAVRTRSLRTTATEK